MSNLQTLVAPGELRASLLDLFEGDRERITIVAAAPGLLPISYDGHAQLARSPHASLSAEQATAHHSATLRFLAEDVDRLPMTDPSWQRIQRWLDSIRAGKADFRYLPRRLIHTRLVSRSTETFIPGGPLCDGSNELDLRLTGAAHNQARRWLTDLIADSLEITGEIEQILAQSWAGDFLTPQDLYLKVLAEYFEPMLGEMDVDADDNPLVAHLTDFQRSAYQAAKGILRRYGGVFLSDVVGLGKTYIALALIGWLERTLGQHAVVVAPPTVLEQWEALRSEFRLAFETVSIGKLDELHQHAGREVLVIDESHNFRNATTLRYETLHSWLRPDEGMSTRRVMLLSATPQNNNPRDVRAQLQLFPDDHQRLPFVGESLDDFFRRVQSGQSSLSELLTHVLVRRTRRFIIDNYPSATVRRQLGPGLYEDVPLAFPRRISGEEQCLRYRIDEAYGGSLYDDVMAAVRTLRYPLHGLFEYVVPHRQEDPRLVGLRRAGASVRGLFRVLLLKRLESSIEAFRISLVRLRERLRCALNDLRKQGIVRICQNPQEQDDEGLLESSEQGIDLSLFNAAALEDAIQHDLARVSDLADAVATERGIDTKLVRLHEYLVARPPAEHRTLVFTQFSDTAIYLSAELGQVFGRTALATGKSGNVMSIARRFAPKAMRCNMPVSEQLDLLIATDVLSEGVNLQDADTIINYDLHWNPVRLIQRGGRIDRIGSSHEEIHVASFMPERGLEVNLGLETVLRRRIGEFLEVFGDDSSVLPSDELPDIDAAITAYTGEAFARAEAIDETDGMSRHFERLNAIRVNEPDHLERLRALRPGKRAASSLDAPTVTACRLGWHWAFNAWSKGGSEEPVALDDLRGLDLLYAHARAAVAKDVGHEAFTQIVASALERFRPEAELFRQQRHRPRLSLPEQYILRQLDEYWLVSPAPRRAVIEEVRNWVLTGHQKVRLQRLGRIWTRQRPTAATIFQELAASYRRFAPRSEELGEAQLSGIVVGCRSDSNS